MPDCDGCPKGDGWYCINGVTYGFCESEFCGGVCEPNGDCECECHKGTA